MCRRQQVEDSALFLFFRVARQAIVLVTWYQLAIDKLILWPSNVTLTCEGVSLAQSHLQSATQSSTVNGLDGFENLTEFDYLRRKVF